MAIETNFDISFIADLALREKQIQQNYRPIIAVHKWFARRPGTLFRGLLLSEFLDQPLRETYYQSHQLKGKRIADPFMGGGTPLLEANRLGCDITGFDINPMAHWIVTEEIKHLDLEMYRASAAKLGNWLERKIGSLYTTRCLLCGTSEARAKYFLWVKVLHCEHCSHDFDLFPGYLLAHNRRHPHNVMICGNCGCLNNVADLHSPGRCFSCQAELLLAGPAKKNHCACPFCGVVNRYPVPKDGPPRHRMFAIEYYCGRCRQSHQGRFFKRPDSDDLGRYEKAASVIQTLTTFFIPDDSIPLGDETNRLHRWGYRFYRELFNARQLLGLETICSGIVKQADERIRHALSTNLSDLLRYQNMLCRYDAMALKSLDIFSIHGFPVGLIQCESNILGLSGSGITNIGSGGWSNITEKYARAKKYCTSPFEVRHDGARKFMVPMTGEWIGERKTSGDTVDQRSVTLCCMSSTVADLPPGTVDAVFTDPPYFGNVQYAELMDFCYIWLRKLIGPTQGAFSEVSTRRAEELTGNITMERDLSHFASGLSQVFQRMERAMKPGAPFAFTFHHNKLEAYHPVTVAILDANFVCTKAIPCPAEMGASIHINGSGSSILDTIFVCRHAGNGAESGSKDWAGMVLASVEEDIGVLQKGGIRATPGDIRCLSYGHITRLAIAQLRNSWSRDRDIKTKLNIVSATMSLFGNLPDLLRRVQSRPIASIPDRTLFTEDAEEVAAEQ